MTGNEEEIDEELRLTNIETAQSSMTCQHTVVARLAAGHLNLVVPELIVTGGVQMWWPATGP